MVVFLSGILSVGIENEKNWRKLFFFFEEGW